jgi:surface antigen
VSRARIDLAMLFSAALLVPTSAAEASSSVICTGYSSCSSKGYSSFGYSTHQSTSYWRMYTGTNCTNYVAYRLVTTNGMPNVRPKSGVGNAQDWGYAMSSVTNSTPTVGSVAWWGRTGHHVAYVEKIVSSSEIWVSESNWSGAFDWRKITKSGSGWPDGFIHFKDLKILNTAKPTISGTVKVGGPLTASGGAWSPTGNTYAYRWQADGQAISGATAKTFTPTTAQLGKQLSVSVTATRPSYPAVKATSSAIKVAPGKLAATQPPVITGTARVDSTLSASLGAWSPSGATYAYQWFVDGTPVPGATRSTFTLRPGDMDHRVKLQVTASKSGYANASASSATTGVIAPGLVTPAARPSISGKPAVGTRLTASPGTWSTSGLTYAYQWFVNGTAVSGATGPTFVPRAADVDLPVTVHVTATRPGYATTTAMSSRTAAVARGAFVVRSRPAIADTYARVGRRLTATPGTWSPSGTYTYQWYADGVRITGATGPSFVPTGHQRGSKLRVQVTARRDGYLTTSALTDYTPAIAYGYINLVKPPVIATSPRLGTGVSVSPGQHTPSGATLRYQWLRAGKVIPGATGRTHRVNERDLGHRLSARVTFSATGYTARTVTTTQSGWAKARSTLSASATPGRRQVTFSIRAAAAGVAAPDGTVRVGSAGGQYRTVKVVDGRAKLTLTSQSPGPHTYVFTFSGTSTVTSATYRRTVTIR